MPAEDPLGLPQQPHHDDYPPAQEVESVVSVDPGAAEHGAAAVAPSSMIADWGNAILNTMEQTIVGKRDALRLLVAGVLANGHVLLEDAPGLAKTLIARSFAQVADLSFSRVQFTPDLVPGDITGSNVLDLETRQPIFKPGPIFANLVLGDEINRAPPKTQAALLEAMEERQVTVDGFSHALPQPFLVIATQNPIESGGTYPLPEAQLDRFLLKFGVGYPSQQDEAEILARRAERRSESTALPKILDAAILRGLQEAVESIHVSRPVLDYMAALAGATRTSPHAQIGASPRGSLALLKASRAWAGLAGRDFVTPDDVIAIAEPALVHRIVVKPDDWLRGIMPSRILEACIDGVPAPSATG